LQPVAVACIRDRGPLGCQGVGPGGPGPQVLLPMRPGLWFALLVAVGLFALTGFYPLQSEDWNHLENIAAFTSWRDAFDPHISHARPLQHLSLWWLMSAGMEHPALLRVPSFLMHALIGGIVGMLASRLGASRRRSLLAIALFLCFPAVKGLAWIVAISTPQRVLFMLAALVAAVAHAQRPRATTGIALLAAQLLALACHSASCLLPAGVATLAVALAPNGRRILLDPWLVLHFLVGTAYLIMIVAMPADQRYHTLSSPGAIAANSPRALLSLLPETVRGPAIEGLRGAYGTVGVFGGAALCVAVGGGLMWLLWRMNAVGRALLLTAGIDLIPPVLTAGFVVRYAYYAAALVVIVLLLAAKPNRRWVIGLSLLGMAWLYDHGVDITEVRLGGQLGLDVVAAAKAVRAEVGPGVQVALLDPPGEVGAERDVPVFNWGLSRALAGHGIAGPWQFVRTRSYVTTSDIELVDAARLAELTAAGVQVWRWDDAQRIFVRD
jgi:hypothetical protein